MYTNLEHCAWHFQISKLISILQRSQCLRLHTQIYLQLTTYHFDCGILLNEIFYLTTCSSDDSSY